MSKFWLKGTLAEKVALFLETRLIDTKFFILDLWSFVHISSGVILAFLLPLIKIEFIIKNDILVAFTILALYEVFEILLRGYLFKAESSIEILWDLIFGMIGFLIIKLLL